MRILFMGTPDIAAECLKALYAAGHDICAVYTRRDKPVGRKQVLTAPPVKEVALEIRLRQPACLPAAQVPWQRPGAVGSPQWGR